MTIKQIASNKMYGGQQNIYQHASDSCNCDMTFGVYLPPQVEYGQCPVLYFLSGLTCTEQNAVTKANAQQYCAKHGIIFVVPDTSPRGQGVADDEASDLGQGAGFYVNATQEPWVKHYHMDDYVVHELPKLIAENFPGNGQAGIMGHSMGGHGALTLALKNPGKYQSVSAFSPIVAPTQCPWGQKAFTAYFGKDSSLWEAHDATCLVRSAHETLPLLIDQGEADGFLETQLKPHLFADACKAAQYPLQLRMQPGYDHSYFFIATFMADHIHHHAQALGV